MSGIAWLLGQVFTRAKIFSDVGIQESTLTVKMKMSQCQCPIPTGERQVDQDAADNISVQPCGGSCT